ncbi:uncharacterized protein EV154DRAFT_520325 [Mucor mucedo]|uniref:uncharacterized protein n=1 Tax=Mucor mucedo TaxID=29922 RepID=UPI00221F136B|nr:uncharacterized protein EV154DRAFT_520325 [Mucor mucedo]KAI7887648.1 hypothetical protein EV154DRAFT_520325 [Mucor mucedo]
MTIIDTDIISVTPTMEDKKSSGLDMSESLFELDYDLLLNDTRHAVNKHLFESFFHEEEEENSSDHSSSLPSSPLSKSGIQRPRIMQWGPQDGHQDSTIVSIVLEHTQETGPMKIVFGSITVETAQQQHRLVNANSHENSVWITLAASVPPLLDTRSESNQVQLSVCAFDPLDPDLAIDTWDIGHFIYRDIPKVYPKRALSNEPEETRKKRTLDIKRDSDVDSQLLKLLAPYDPLLTAVPSSSGESPHLNLTTPQSAASASWMSSPMDDNPQQNYSQVNLPPSINIINNNNNNSSIHQMNTPFPSSSNNIMLQHGLVNSRPLPSNHHLYGQQSQYMSHPLPPKEDVYRDYLDVQEQQQQERQRQAHAYSMGQHQFMSQAMNTLMHTNYTIHPFDPSSDCHTNNPVLYNMTEGEKQNQQFQRLQQQRQQRDLMTQYNTNNNTRRASAPVSSYSITNSNSCALNKAHLKLNGDLMNMITNWSMPEWQSGRRLVQFWRHANTGADGQLSLVECGFEPMDQQVYHQQRMRDNVAAVAAAAAAAVAVSNASPSLHGMNNNSSRPTPIVISCIYWRERNDYFITSVDCIYLLESLIGIQFTVEEKNRIRRNLEGFRPLTVSKCKIECADFFKLIMSFPHPKPRNIEKDVKVFAWKTLPHALRKIIRKYTPSYITSAPLEPIHHHPHQQQQHTQMNRTNHPYSSNIF